MVSVSATLSISGPAQFAIVELRIGAAVGPTVQASSAAAQSFPVSLSMPVPEGANADILWTLGSAGVTATATTITYTVTPLTGVGAGIPAMAQTRPGDDPVLVTTGNPIG